MTSAWGFNGDAVEQQLIEAARGMRSLLRRNIPLHEQHGKLSDEVLAAVCEAGFHKMAVPARWGGLHLSSAAMARVGGEIARGCPSTAWALSITNSVAWLVSQMPDSMQQFVFGKGIPLLTGPQNGAGTLEPAEGGYLFSGRWSYGTNCRHADFAMLQGVCTEGLPHLCVVRMSEVGIVDTWKVAGMRGTGSDTVVADKVFVPKAHSCLMQGIGSAEDFSYPKEPGDYWIGFPLLRSKAIGILVGAVEGQLDAIVDSSARPVLYSVFQQKQDAASYRALLGDAAGKIRAARTIMDSSNTANDRAALARRALTPDERLDNRVETAAAIRLLNEASSTLMDMAGSSGFAESSLAQQYWRDFNVGSRHVIFNAYVSNEAFGTSVLGRAQEILPADCV